VRKVSIEEIEAAKTEKGGWTRAQLALWGVPWPPPKGWKERLISGVGEASEPDEFELVIEDALRALAGRSEAALWTNATWTQEVRATIGALVRDRGYEWYATDRGLSQEWLWDGAAWVQRNGWVIRQSLVMESEWGGPESVKDDFQRLMVARAEHRLMIFGAYSERNAEKIIGELIEHLGRFEQSLPRDRYLFACWLNDKRAFMFRVHVT